MQAGITNPGILSLDGEAVSPGPLLSGRRAFRFIWTVSTGVTQQVQVVSLDNKSGPTIVALTSNLHTVEKALSDMFTLASGRPIRLKIIEDKGN